MNVNIDISIECNDWPEGAVDFDAVINAALQEVDFARKTELSLVLADDAFVQKLNAQYRDKNRPTNVLSFPQDNEGDCPTDFCLGDLVLAYETIMREAKEQNKSFADHLTHLLVHGVLHLLGYDHQKKEKAEEMEALEITILSKMGIADPYENDTLGTC